MAPTKTLLRGQGSNDVRGIQGFFLNKPWK